MFGVTPYNPNSLRRRGNKLMDFNNLFDEFFSENSTSLSEFKDENFKLDVQETDKEYQIEAEMPGFKKDEVTVQCEDEMITISASKKEEKDENKGNYIHKERMNRFISRSMYLPNIDNDNIKANLEEGILKVKIPKKVQGNNKKQITVD